MSIVDTERYVFAEGRTSGSTTNPVSNLYYHPPSRITVRRLSFYV